MFREIITQSQNPQLKCRYMDWAVQVALGTATNPCEGTDSIRRVVDLVLTSPGASLLLYKSCLEAERRCPVQNHQRLKLLLENSVNAFPMDVGLWLQYLQVEKGRAMDSVYWRARKALPSTEHDRLSAEYARVS